MPAANPTRIQSSTKKLGIFVTSTLLVNARRRNSLLRQTPAPGSRRSSKRNHELLGGTWALTPSSDTRSRLRLHYEKPSPSLHAGSHAPAACAARLPARCAQRSWDRREIP